MGYFSWKTSDTNESISNRFSNRGALSCKMILPNGTEYAESNYDGYGVFGDHDIYEVIAKLNGKSERHEGIKLAFSSGVSGDFDAAAKAGVILPKLVSIDFAGAFDDVPYPENCEFQGYFYD